jgi:sterol desaturase/sphingolipid hydroxylase (fatty acid hydroxylase superfamily)
VRDVALAVLRQFLLFGALLTPLEILRPAHAAQRFWRRGFFTDLVYFAAGPFLIGAGSAILLGLLGAFAGALVPAGARAALQAQPWALQLAEIFVLAELGGYWVHRASHRVRWLWRFHAVHHSVEELDWLAAHRQHPLEAVWLLGVANLPVMLLGFSTEALLGFVLLQKLHTAFVHANVRVGFGRFTLLLASPEFHHWHHDGAAGARGCNFASALPWIDRLFGTWRAPDGKFPERYGCDAPVPRGWLGQLAFPFRRSQRSGRAQRKPVPGLIPVSVKNPRKPARSSIGSEMK